MNREQQGYVKSRRDKDGSEGQGNEYLDEGSQYSSRSQSEEEYSDEDREHNFRRGRSDDQDKSHSSHSSSNNRTRSKSEQGSRSHQEIPKRDDERGSHHSVIMSPMTRTTFKSGMEEPSALDLICKGTASMNAANRLKESTNILRPYAPETDKNKIPKEKGDMPTLNSVKDIATQLTQLMSHCELLGMAPWTFLNLLKTGKQLASQSSFRPRINFDPKERLDDFIQANEELNTTLYHYSEDELIQRQIQVLLEIHLKIFTLSLDSTTVKKKMAMIKLESPETAGKTLKQLTSWLEYIDGTHKDHERLLISEFIRACHEYDMEQKKRGRNSSVVKDVREKSISIESDYKKRGQKLNGRELLFFVTIQLEQENDEMAIECGQGSTYMKISDESENVSRSTGHQTSTDSKMKFIRDKLRNAKRSQKVLMLGNSGAIDTSQESGGEEIELVKAKGANTGEFLQVFSEYIIDGGSNLQGIADETGIEYERLQDAAILVQKSQEQVEIRAQQELDRVVAEKDREMRRLEDQRYRESSRSSGTMRTRKLDWSVTTSDEEEENEAVMVNASYKQMKHAKEMGSGTTGRRMSFSQQQNKPQSPVTTSTPPDHCFTCGLHKTECTSIGPQYRDSSGQDQCFLRDDLQCQVDMNIVNLDKLKLASLSPPQADLVITAAAKYGCLRGSTQERLNEYKTNFIKFKETLGQTIKNSSSL